MKSDFLENFLIKIQVKQAVEGRIWQVNFCAASKERIARAPGMRTNFRTDLLDLGTDLGYGLITVNGDQGWPTSTLRLPMICEIRYLYTEVIINYF